MIRFDTASGEAERELAASIVHENLPDVPESEVIRLVYSYDTETIVMRAAGQVLGTATFRLHEDADFADLLFFVTQVHQKGHGQRMMRELKERLFRGGDAHYLVTYAGNDSLHFFRKQAFVPAKEVDFGLDTLVLPRIEVFSNAELMAFDFTTEFEAPNLKAIRACVHVGDQVMVRHGIRFPTWRPAWVVALTDRKLQASYADGKSETEWVPLSSRRLLTDSLTPEVQGSLGLREKYQAKASTPKKKQAAAPKAEAPKAPAAKPAKAQQAKKANPAAEKPATPKKPAPKKRPAEDDGPRTHSYGTRFSKKA